MRHNSNQLDLAYQVAKKEKGTREFPGPKSNKRILEYHSTCKMKADSDEVPWCSAFVNWCYIMAGYLINPHQMNYKLVLAGFSKVELDLYKRSAILMDEKICYITDIEKLADTCRDVNLPTFSAAARSWVDWGKKTDDSIVSDLVILSRGSNTQSGHVAFFSGFENETVSCLGGNQQDQVMFSNYLPTKVVSFITEEYK